MPRAGRAPHHDGAYRRIAKVITDAAKADPRTTCRRCGLTLAQHRPHKNGRAPFWTCGHVVEGDGRYGFGPEVSTCNFAAGARYTNAKRRTEPRITNWWAEPHSEDWAPGEREPEPRPVWWA